MPPVTSRLARRQQADDAVVALAARQHGVVSRPQLLAAGLTADVIDRRLGTRQYRALHRGVYQLGPIVAPHAAEMAAVLASGASAFVSHRSAAMLWQAPPYAGSKGAAVDVIVLRGQHRRPGIRAHRCALRADETTTFDGIPLTTPARTLYDLARTVPQRDLERALADLLDRGLAARAELLALLTRYARHRGTRRLHVLLEREQPLLRTRSEAEEAFLALLRGSPVPLPDANVRIEGYEVDFLWRAQRFVVEIDGFAYHASRRRIEGDKRRDAVLAAAGVRMMRVTWRQLTEEPKGVLVRLALALARL